MSTYVMTDALYIAVLHLLCSFLQVTRLRYTPRKFVIHPDHNTLIVAEADHAAVPAAERRATESGMDTDVQQAEVFRGLLSYLLLMSVSIGLDFHHIYPLWTWWVSQSPIWSPHGHGHAGH